MKRFIIALIVVISSAVMLHARIINVPADYSTIQAAIDSSAYDDTVLVSPGTYMENINFNGRSILLASQFIFGEDTSFISQTIIDGDSNASVITINGAEGERTGVCGFTVQNGQSFLGGGISCANSNPTISHNIIKNNEAEYGGGGIICVSGNVIIKSNRIVDNSATGIVWPTRGGGIYCYNANVQIIDNIIEGNTCNPDSGNLGLGGGIQCHYSNAIIKSNVIKLNSSNSDGGGIDLPFSTAIIMNNLIIYNSAFINGGGIHGSGTIINNTLAGNSAGYYGGGYCSDGGSNRMIINNIFWDNIAPNDPQISDASSEINYCDIQGGRIGQGNIDADPLFRDPFNGDYRLQITECGYPATSPCVDTGSPIIQDSLLSCGFGLGTRLSDMGAYAGGDSLQHIGRTLDVPDDYGTIQGAIDASFNNDTIIVSPGTYVENIRFGGRNIILASLFYLTGDQSYISSTIIDGNGSGSVVTLQSGEDGTSVISGFTLRNGYSGSGGGIYCCNSGAIIQYNIICQNTAYHEYGGNGGGIACEHSSPTIMGNIITENISNGVGGGISFIYSNARVINNILIGNSSGYNGGGGLFLSFSNPRITDNTIYGNSSELRGGGIWLSYNCSPIMINTILRSNWSNSDPEIGYESGSLIRIRYSNIEGGWSGEGNIDCDPLFRDPLGGDFHLMAISCDDSANSPCIDAGDPAIVDSIQACNWGLGMARSDIGFNCGNMPTPWTDLNQSEISAPVKISLLFSYPNPFNPSTTIKYSISQSSNVQINIFNLLGQKVENLFDGYQNAGEYSVLWIASEMPSGVYFAKLNSEKNSKSIKMMLLK